MKSRKCSFQLGCPKYSSFICVWILTYHFEYSICTLPSNLKFRCYCSTICKSVLAAKSRPLSCTKALLFQSLAKNELDLAAVLFSGCDLPGVGGWEGSTHPFVLFNPVLPHYEKLLHACIYILDPPTFFGTNHTLAVLHCPVDLKFNSIHRWFL